MIFSLFKGFFIIIFAGILGVIAGYLNDLPGGINLVLNAQEFRFSFLTATLIILILIAVFFLVFKILAFFSAILSFLRGDDTAIKRFFEKSREKRGLNSFLKSLIALEEGESEKALMEAKKAEKLLRLPEMTALLGAKVSQFSGFISTEKEYNKKLLKYADTRLVGLRGLINSSIDDGDFTTALALAMKARELNPKNASISQVLFKLQCKIRDWEGAHKSVTEMYKQKHSLTGDELRRWETVVLTALAKENQLKGHTEKSISSVRLALKKTPSFIPAVVLCAELEHLVGKKSAGIKIIKSSWANEPHPLLASVYANFFPDETPDSRLERFQSLLRNSNHIETAIVTASLNIAVEDFPKARSVLVPYTEGEIDARVATLMAAAEKGCGEDEKVISGWLAKSASAKRPPEWICSQCGNIDSWQPVCSKCHSFDSQIWSVPSQSTELHHGLTTLPFVLDNTSSDNSTDNLDFSESSENMSSEAEDSVQFDSEDKDDNYNTVTKGKGVDRGKEKEKSEIADNARKII